MRLLYFAWLKTKMGRAEEEVDPPPEVTDVASLLEWLRGRGPEYAESLGDLSVVRVAVNQEYARLDAPVNKDDEVAFFPPVTGG